MQRIHEAGCFAPNLSATASTHGLQDEDLGDERGDEAWRRRLRHRCGQ
jgi:hypothetical protein